MIAYIIRQKENVRFPFKRVRLVVYYDIKEMKMLAYIITKKKTFASLSRGLDWLCIISLDYLRNEGS